MSEKTGKEDVYDWYRKGTCCACGSHPVWTFGRNNLFCLRCGVTLPDWMVQR